MDNKNKIFFAVFFTLIAAVVIITFTKYFVAKDYYIQAEADCDPYEQKCFIWNCDPKSTVEGEKCTGDPETDTWYFQRVKKIANEIPLCDPNDENCDALSCVSGMDCEVTYCDEKTVGEGETCNDPVKYTEENPIEEEAEECAPDDEECLSAQEEECAPDDEECLSAQDEECAPDDEECVNEEDSGDESDPGDGDVQEEEGGTGDESSVNVENFVG